MYSKKYRVVISRFIDLNFSSAENAVNFIEGFNFARRQREEILYEFKNPFKTRGYAFAFRLLAWMKKQNISYEWFSAHAYLTISEK